MRYAMMEQSMAEGLGLDPRGRMRNDERKLVVVNERELAELPGMDGGAEARAERLGIALHSLTKIRQLENEMGGWA